jgi:hypothetical protein
VVNFVCQLDGTVGCPDIWWSHSIQHFFWTRNCSPADEVQQWARAYEQNKSFTILQHSSCLTALQWGLKLKYWPILDLKAIGFGQEPYPCLSCSQDFTFNWKHTISFSESLAFGHGSWNVSASKTSFTDVYVCVCVCVCNLVDSVSPENSNTLWTK